MPSLIWPEGTAAAAVEAVSETEVSVSTVKILNIGTS